MDVPDPFWINGYTLVKTKRVKWVHCWEGSSEGAPKEVAGGAGSFGGQSRRKPKPADIAECIRRAESGEG